MAEAHITQRQMTREKHTNSFNEFYVTQKPSERQEILRILILQFEKEWTVSEKSD